MSQLQATTAIVHVELVPLPNPNVSIDQGLPMVNATGNYASGFFGVCFILLRERSLYNINRCHRLNKDCTIVQPVVRQRKPRRTTRVAQLEKKLDGIVSLLQASQNAGNHSSLTPPDSQPEPLTPEKSPTASTSIGQQLDQHGPGPDVIQPQENEDVGNKSISELPFTYLSHAAPSQRRSTHHCLLNYPSSEPDDDEVDRLIRVYQEELTTQFPFVILPPGLKAATLRQSKPFLYMTVVMAASHYNLPRQTLFEKKIVEYLSDHLLLRGLKTLDLVQGLLVFCSWYHYHCLYHSQLTTFIQLAVGIVADLGLNKSPNVIDRARFSSVRITRDSTIKIRTSEERRAVLGCFYLTSVVSSCFQKIDSLRFTSHMDECARFLSENPEYPTDIYLVHLVQLQRTVERITKSVLHHQWEGKTTIKAPLDLHMKMFEDELSRLHSALPSELQENKFLLMHYHIASIHLHEIALNDLSQIDALYALLLGVNSFINTLLTIPSSSYLSISFITWSQLSFAITTLARLSCPIRNLTFVKDVLDYVTVLETFATRFEEAKQSLGPEITSMDDSKGYTDSLDKYAKKMRMIVNMYVNRLKAKFPVIEEAGSAGKDVPSVQAVESGIQQTGWDAVPQLPEQTSVTDATNAPAVDETLYTSQEYEVWDDDSWWLPGMTPWWDGHYHDNMMV
ncbi:hypothetical protein F5884DRAFT_787485 [Xylogone sp. PMI_703]|nr:hypothetical protein F5884DRAFT_787485 [Xylogone sp. PMI_703]